MVTKRKRAAPRRAAPRTRTVYRAAPRKRRTVKAGYDKIAPAAATVALVAVNASKIKGLANSITNNGREKIVAYPVRALNGITGQNAWVNGQMKKFISADALVTDALAVAGGYIGGEIVRKYAPTVIKRPIAKIAKKIPRVF